MTITADTIERKRTDAAERMKNAHQAAAYKGWLTKEVQEAIDDPRPSVPHAQVAAEWATDRAGEIRVRLQLNQLL